MELKAKTKVPRKLQEKIISKMRKAGADVRTADTKEKVDQIIDEIIK